MSLRASAMLLLYRMGRITEAEAELILGLE